MINTYRPDDLAAATIDADRRISDAAKILWSASHKLDQKNGSNEAIERVEREMLRLVTRTVQNLKEDVVRND